MTRCTRFLTVTLTLAGAVMPRAAAQAVPRADLPGPRTLRLTVDARFEWWDSEFIAGTKTALGAPLTGDPLLVSPALPDLERLRGDLGTAGNQPPPLALSLGVARLSVLASRRTTPVQIEYGVTRRLAVGVTVPIVRTFVRSSLAFDTAAAGNLGLNPLLDDPTAVASYNGFFNSFNTAIGNVTADSAAFGCPGSPQCAQFHAFLADALGVRDALFRSVYGPGQGGGAAFLPVAGTSTATAIDANITRIQNDLRSTYGDSSFAATFLFPPTAVDGAGFATALQDSAFGYNQRPFGDTPRSERTWLGDIELVGRFALADGPVWRATVGALWRLPTGHQDSPNDPLDVAAGDGQADLEADLTQELILARRVWLNLAVRGGIQQPGTRQRRVAPPVAFLVRPQAVTTLQWDPGDYWAVDFAPLYKLHPQLALGFTVGLAGKGADRYTYRTPQDSIDLAARLGAGVPAGHLDGATAWQRTRVGGALTYVGPLVETSATAERTVSASDGRVPAAWTFRLVVRVVRRLF